MSAGLIHEVLKISSHNKHLIKLDYFDLLTT